MLDLNRLHRIQLSAEPVGQKVVGALLLMPNYEVLPGVSIRLEGAENLPDEPVIYAMNHTDRYNYWPFQYRLWRDLDRFTATWVKGKYYENELLGKFMELTNNIPTVSRGYLIVRDFLATVERPPKDAEYRALRGAVDMAAGLADPDEVAYHALDAVPEAVLAQARDVFGRPFRPDREDYAAYINGLFGEMMHQFVALNRQAADRGLDILIFPQGTRSKRLSRGRIGLSQMALHLERPVVPVGCNGSDRVYPGGSPVARSGEIVYRIGEPLTYDQMAEFHIDEDFEPFTPEVETEYRDRLQAYVDVVMERINDLLDPQYRFSEDLRADGVGGSRRFV